MKALNAGCQRILEQSSKAILGKLQVAQAIFAET